jgi:HPt (histidine-containing phosphotransfer) domain-containing protein
MSIDHTVLQALKLMIGDDAPGDFAELIDSYLEDSSHLLQTISTAVAQEDAAQLARAAHNLKSTSEAFGALSLATLCQTLETSAHAGTNAVPAALMPQLHAEYANVLTALQQERH